MMFKTPEDREYPDVKLIEDAYMMEYDLNWQDYKDERMYKISRRFGEKLDKDDIDFFRSYDLEPVV